MTEVILKGKRISLLYRVDPRSDCGSEQSDRDQHCLQKTIGRALSSPCVKSLMIEKKKDFNRLNGIGYLSFEDILMIEQRRVP